MPFGPMPNADKRRSIYGDGRSHGRGSLAVYSQPRGTADGNAGPSQEDRSGAREAHGRDHNREQQAYRSSGVILRGPDGSGQDSALAGRAGNVDPIHGLAAGILRDGKNNSRLHREASEVREQQVENFEMYLALKSAMADIRRGAAMIDERNAAAAG